MVRRLVKNQRVRIGEQDARQFDAPPLTAGQRAKLLLHHFLRQAKAVGHRNRLGLGGVPACLVKILHGFVIPVHRFAHHVGVGIGHILFRLAQT